ncbi:MAG: AI-2E family transporter [Bryobacterales bacterium]|jgi:predicted PurR-regulated permease PerM|nr:AI-2E family transporter [Bryobacterales bacterium]
MPERANTELVQRAIMWSLSGLVVYCLYLVSKPFLAALVSATVLSIFAFPLHRMACRNIQSANLAAFTSACFVSLVILVPLGWLIPAFVREALAVARTVPTVEVLPRAKEFFDNYLAQSPIPLGDFDTIVRNLSQRAATLLAEESARLAGNVAGWIIDLVVMVLALFYLFRDGRNVLQILKEVAPMGARHRERMMAEVVELISVTISSGLMVAVMQGFLSGLIFWLIGIPSAVFWGCISGFLAFLPVVGPWLVWAPAGIGLIFSGQMGRGALLLILGFIIISGADNLVRPILIAGRAQLNALLVFVGVFGGIQVFGFIGVVVGPLVVATAVGLIKGYSESLREQRTTQPKSAAAPSAEAA